MSGWGVVYSTLTLSIPPFEVPFEVRAGISEFGLRISELRAMSLGLFYVGSGRFVRRFRRFS